MTPTMKLAFVALACTLTSACGSPSREPLPITPPADVATAPVARVPVTPQPPPPPPPSSASAITPPSKLDPATFPPGSIYVCASGAGSERKVTSITFDEKVGALCRRHPEMGPCQYERNICRGSGGRVYAADGTEITLAIEAEYDKKVMRVRFKAN
jgi:hypothetical protein